MRRIVVALVLGLVTLTGCQSSGHDTVDNSIPAWKKQDIANVRQQCATVNPRSVTFDGFDGQYALYAWTDPVFGTRDAVIDTQDPRRWLETCGA